MENLKGKLLGELSNCVLEMEEERVVEIAQEYINNGFNAYEGIEKGLAIGMQKAGELYEEGEYYIPELLICSDAMYEGIDVLKPHLKYEEGSKKSKVVIGVVEGDTHDIGKNLVKIMMETEGLEIIDLGRDVPIEEFVNTAKKENAEIICLSTLMTTTMDNMRRVIELLEQEKIRDRVKVMIGGGPVSKSFADKIGADAYTADASKAARRAKELIKEMKV